MQTEVETDRESYKVYEWRLQWFLHAGYSKRHAKLLASSDVDYRYAIKLLSNARTKGYDESFVMKLLF